MAKAKDGDTVKVHYTGTLKNDGSVFDSSQGRDPLQFQLGRKQVIPGFEEGIVGMEPGEKKTVDVPVDKGYGQPNPALLFEVDKKELPSNIQPEAGMRLLMTHESGKQMPVTVSQVGDEKITFDANHPLAGKDLVFEIELVEIA